MSDDKTPISQASSYAEAGKYWDDHDLSDVWEKTEAAHFDVDIQGSTTYFAVESGLSERLRKIANRHGVSAETLLNLWLQERVGQEKVDAA